MKIAVILKEAPIPIYTGINLVIHNILIRLLSKYGIKIFILTNQDNLNLSKLLFDCEVYSASKKNTELHHRRRFIPWYAKFYNISSNKMSWLHYRIQEYKPDMVIGFGYGVLGYLGLMETKSTKIMNLIDSDILFLLGEFKQGKISLLNLKHLFASIAMARVFCSKCDAIITVNDWDTLNIKSITGYPNVYTVPNGVDYNFYTPDTSTSKQDGQIVFCGSLNWRPNQQALIWFLKKCWNNILSNEPNTKLLIIGKNPTNRLKDILESYKNVQVLGFVEDIRDYIRCSEVSIAPMISGSGIKNKILEAWSMEMPVIATPLGAKGLICEDGVDILLANNAKLFSSMVIQLLNDNNLRDTLGKNARKNVIENYSWDQMTDKFNQIIMGSDQQIC